MLFCEKCNRLTESDRCDICGKKKLRKPEEDDFCFFVSLHSGQAHYFEENLKLENIPVALIGYGTPTSVRTSGYFKIYLHYGSFERAAEIYNTIFGLED